MHSSSLCKACIRQFNGLTSTPFALTELLQNEVLAIYYLILQDGYELTGYYMEGADRSMNAVCYVAKLLGKADET